MAKNDRTDPIEHIPPEIRYVALEAALRAVREALSNTPFSLDQAGELELLDVLGHLAYDRYLDDAQNEPYPPERSN
jgi:hypothetical protein